MAVPWFSLEIYLITYGALFSKRSIHRVLQMRRQAVIDQAWVVWPSLCCHCITFFWVFGLVWTYAVGPPEGNERLTR
jgi:hypothetical protein